MLAQHANAFDALVLLVRIRQRQQRFDDMLELAERAAALKPSHLGAQFQLVEGLILCARMSDAIATARYRNHVDSLRERRSRAASRKPTSPLMSEGAAAAFDQHSIEQSGDTVAVLSME